MKNLSIATLSLATLVVACSERSPSVVNEEAPANAADAHGPSGTAGAAASAAGLQGSVLETFEGGGYTYARIAAGSDEVWVAAPPVQIAVGDEVEVRGSMVMNDFYSPTLDRTFDEVHFASAIVPAGQAAASGMPAGHGMPAAASAETPSDAAPVEKAAGGVTVEEVFQDRAELVGTEIVLRGNVVKFNGGILGKNWLHLRDGSGGAGTNDLTITTDATCAVGDTVLVRGTLVADRDFGAGYVYDLIVEDAQVSVE